MFRFETSLVCLLPGVFFLKFFYPPISDFHSTASYPSPGVNQKPDSPAPPGHRQGRQGRYASPLLRRHAQAPPGICRVWEFRRKWDLASAESKPVPFGILISSSFPKYIPQICSMTSLRSSVLSGGVERKPVFFPDPAFPNDPDSNLSPPPRIPV